MLLGKAISQKGKGLAIRREKGESPSGEEKTMVKEGEGGKGGEERLLL